MREKQPPKITLHEEKILMQHHPRSLSFGKSTAEVRLLSMGKTSAIYIFRNGTARVRLHTNILANTRKIYYYIPGQASQSLFTTCTNEYRFKNEV
jgi:oxalate decarboxylase/phosphoglucose isomerase-like protein (cupin superfamily)